MKNLGSLVSHVNYFRNLSYRSRGGSSVEFYEDSLEPCAIQGPDCRRLTTYWTTLPDRKPEGQVAVCQACSKAHEPKDVPSKTEWFARHARP